MTFLEESVPPRQSFDLQPTNGPQTTSVVFDELLFLHIVTPNEVSLNADAKSIVLLLAIVYGIS